MKLNKDVFYHVLISLWIVALQHTRASSECGSVDDCSVAETRICAFDVAKVCFMHFESICHMEYEACDREKNFKVFDEAFCGLDNFMCDEEFEKYSSDWAYKENIDDTILQIYKPKRKSRREQTANSRNMLNSN